jgi:putative heme-binding domain-containing protein
LRGVDDREALLALVEQADPDDRFMMEAAAIALRGREDLVARPAGWDRKAAVLLWVLRAPGTMEWVAGHARREPEALEMLGRFTEPEAGEAMARFLADGVPLETRRRALRLLEKNVSMPWWRPLAKRADLRAEVDRLCGVKELAEDARRLSAVLGTRTLVKWRISPGYEARDCAGYDRAFPPEGAAEPERLEGWTEAKTGADGRVDLRAQRPAHLWMVGYAATLVEAREETETRLLLGYDDSAKVWVNGELVHAPHEHRAIFARDVAVPVRFAPGVNRVLVKIENRLGAWGFIAEVEDPEGRLAEVTERAGPPWKPSGERLDPARLPPAAELLAEKGDAARGREVFFRSGAACAKCHRARGEGGEIGPDLSTIGSKLARDGLLLSILRPSDAIPPEFTAWIVRTRSGAIHAGVPVEETPERLVLRDVEGRPLSIAKAEIEERKKSEVSPMPDGLVRELSRRDLADLLEYLAGLR